MNVPLTTQPAATPPIPGARDAFPFRRSTAVLALLAGSVLWSYWSTLGALAARWSSDPQYSHGFLVPLMAAALVWMRRERLAGLDLAPSAWGAAVVAAAMALRLAGTWWYVDWIEGFSLVPCVAGGVLLVGGWPLLRHTWPAVLFLAFMLPLPFRAEVALAQPLQATATAVSTFLLQTAGYPAVAQGNVIVFDDVRLGVAEACSGLRMLVIFFAVSTAVALVVARPLWERIVVVLSAVPIALACNVLRITVTGILYDVAGGDVARVVFHDLAGWLMMPMALGMLWLELQVLSRLWIEAPGRRIVPVAPRRAWGMGR